MCIRVGLPRPSTSKGFQNVATAKKVSTFFQQAICPFSGILNFNLWFEGGLLLNFVCISMQWSLDSSVTCIADAQFDALKISLESVSEHQFTIETHYGRAVSKVYFYHSIGFHYVFLVILLLRCVQCFLLF